MEIAQNLAHIRQQIADCHPTQEVTLWLSAKLNLSPTFSPPITPNNANSAKIMYKKE